MFAAWGVDYVKLDWCYIPFGDYPHMSHQQVSLLLAQEMGRALFTTGRSIVYDINDWTNDAPWMWAPGPGPHVEDDCRTATTTGRASSPSSRAMSATTRSPGRAAGTIPDMLEVGNGGMTTTEYQASSASGPRWPRR